MKHKLFMGLGIAAVVVVVVIVMKKGLLKDVPVIGPYLSL